MLCRRADLLTPSSDLLMLLDALAPMSTAIAQELVTRLPLAQCACSRALCRFAIGMHQIGRALTRQSNGCRAGAADFHLAYVCR